MCKLPVIFGGGMTIANDARPRRRTAGGAKTFARSQRRAMLRSTDCGSYGFADREEDMKYGKLTTFPISVHYRLVAVLSISTDQPPGRNTRMQESTEEKIPNEIRDSAPPVKRKPPLKAAPFAVGREGDLVFALAQAVKALRSGDALAAQLLFDFHLPKYGDMPDEKELNRLQRLRTKCQWYLNELSLRPSVDTPDTVREFPDEVFEERPRESPWVFTFSRREIPVFPAESRTT